MMLWAAIFSVSLVFPPVTLASRRAYTAAAYEHSRFGRLSDPPNLIREKNLEAYQKAGKVANFKGADILVFPEYGIFYPGNRTTLKNFLEDIPDPKILRVNPCEEPEAYSQRPIILTLSCIAKNNSIFVVANTGDIKNCTGESDCPKDGVFHYNTNVVFNRNGTLVLRYYKEHLFFELGMDLPKEQQDTTFKTDFGTFATYICFDILFERMSQVAKWPQVDGIMFSTMFFDYTPQYVSVPFGQGWALGNNATIIFSNVQMPVIQAVGSGIFHGQYGSLAYTYSPDRISKLVVAEVPISGEPILTKSSITAITDTKIWDWKEDGSAVPYSCSDKKFNDTCVTAPYLNCIAENTANYTLIKLDNSSGYIEACNKGMCCSVNYTADDMSEDYYLGVYNGSYNAFNRYYWCEESCFIARCDEVKGRPCATFPKRANTVFHNVEIRANFTTQYIYPSVVSSKVRLVPITEWEFNIDQKASYESSIHFHSEEGKSLINAGFTGRCYQRDPPYVR